MPQMMDMPNQTDTEHKLPLGICRQAVMKLESFALDIREILEDEELDPVDKQNFTIMAEVAGTMMANIINIVSREIGEEEFLAEEIGMDKIDPYPGMDDDIMDQPLGEDV